MSEAIRWWLILQVVALPLLPLCLALFRRLPDRGYALSKPFGLLLLGYVFWLLNSLQILPNSNSGVILALALLMLVSATFAYREREALPVWLREHWQYIAGVEVLFLVVFFTAVWLRSMVGQISGTEQPMDLMFINATLRADHFPPKDPWLSGHDVAYYYFGYLIVMMVGRMAGVAADVSYNIGLAMTATMALVGAAGLVYNLVQMREHTEDAAAPAALARRFNWRPPLFGIAGGLMLVVMGNLVWVFMFSSAYGIGGTSLYDFVDVSGLTPDMVRHAWYPAQFFGFFNASRIYPINNQDYRVITEFPMFSFLLGDLHPHVMDLPFVLLVVGAAISLYRSPEPLDITFWLERPLALVATAMLVGGLAFINTWDIAALTFVVILTAFAGNFMRVRAITLDLWVQIISFALPLVLLALLMYSPFLLSIAGNSQADGIGAVVSSSGVPVPATRPFHLLLFWGPLFTLVIPFIGARLLAQRERVTLRIAAIVAAPGALVVIAWALWFSFQKASGSGKLGAGAGGLGSQIGDRGTAWFTALFLVAALATAILALWLEVTADGDRAERESPVFALAIAAVALLLVLGTEFFYVGDVFNNRMNTVFKLYYEAWLLLAIAGGFSLYYLASRWRVTFPRATEYRYAWAAAVVLMLAGASLYPLGGTFNRVRPYDAAGHRSSGDGELAGLGHFSRDDLNAFAWLDDRAQGQDLVIAEAVDGDYREGGRVSMATGIPTIIGWQGHEDQWRSGTCKPCAGRFQDVQTLYQTADAAAMRQVIQKYDVTFVYVGELERRLYGAAGMEKFKSLQVAFTSGAVTIYRAKGVTGEVEATP